MAHRVPFVVAELGADVERSCFNLHAGLRRARAQGDQRATIAALASAKARGQPSASPARRGRAIATPPYRWLPTPSPRASRLPFARPSPGGRTLRQIAAGAERRGIGTARGGSGKQRHCRTVPSWRIGECSAMARAGRTTAESSDGRGGVEGGAKPLLPRRDIKTDRRRTPRTSRDPSASASLPSDRRGSRSASGRPRSRQGARRCSVRLGRTGAGAAQDRERRSDRVLSPRSPPTVRRRFLGALLGHAFRM